MSNVQALIDAALARTTTLTTQATDAIGTAVTSVQSMGYTGLTYGGMPALTPPPKSLTTQIPPMDNVALELPIEPDTKLTFQDISAIQLDTMPTLDATKPSFSNPGTPSQLAGFSQAAPTINTALTFPDPPDALMHPVFDAPVIGDRTEPTKPQILLPSFSSAAPVNDTVVPTDLAGQFDSAYRSAAPTMISMINGYVDAELAKINPQYATQMAAIEAQLSKYLAGGTGLKPEVEDAIYARARSKNNAEAIRVRDQALTDAATRGFTIPGGALLSAMQQARQGGADNNAKAAAEIVVMQAEMEQKNLQFAVTTSAGLRTTLLQTMMSYMQNLSQINSQALDYAKSILTSVIELYNASVRAYSLKLDAYRAEAAVYETRLRGAMASVELYKAEVEALLALTNVDRAKIDVYRARIETLSALANVYRSQIEAVMGRVTLEKAKLDVFSAQVQAYSAQVQGKNAEWMGYRAQIEGQVAQAQLYNTQVQAYGTQVQAFKTKVDAQSEVVRAIVATNQARATQFAATMQGYQTVVQARGTVANTQIENQRQKLIAFQAATARDVANAQVANEYYRSLTNTNLKQAELYIQATVSGAEMKRAYSSSLTALNTSLANIYGSMAGASMSGLNALAAEVI